MRRHAPEKMAAQHLPGRCRACANESAGVRDDGLRVAERYFARLQRIRQEATEAGALRRSIRVDRAIGAVERAAALGHCFQGLRPRTPTVGLRPRAGLALVAPEHDEPVRAHAARLVRDESHDAEKRAVAAQPAGAAERRERRGVLRQARGPYAPAPPFREDSLGSAGGTRRVPGTGDTPP